MSINPQKNFSRRWRFFVNEISKDGNQEKKKPIVLKNSPPPIQNIAQFQKCVGHYQISVLPFYSESRLELFDIDHSAIHDITRFSVVNFPVEQAVNVYIRTTLALLCNEIVIPGEIEAISLYRRLQNFSIVIDISGHDPSRNPLIIERLHAYLQQFRTDSETPEFSIELFSLPQKVLDKGLQDCLNFKNTVDSVKNFLNKRPKNII